MKAFIKIYWPVFALMVLVLVLMFGCHDVTPSETKADTIRDTVYRSYKNGKLFGVEINYRKRKSIKDYR